MRVSSGSGSRFHRRAVASLTGLSLVVAATMPLAIMTTSSPAYAQAPEASSQDIAQARQLGQQAQAAYDKGDFAESEKLWYAASKLYTQAPTLTLGLARTQAKLSKFVAAQESYNKIVREWGNNPNPPPAFKDAVEAAKNEVGAVSAKVASVTVSIEGPANPQVTIDGQPVPAAALGLKRPVDPGSHKVSATADGYKAADTTFSVTEGGSAAATLKMEKDPNAVVAGAGGATATPGGTGGPASPSEPGADTGGKGSSNKTLALVAFGVGGAGLVVGAITGGIALGKAGDLKDKCGPNKDQCPTTAQSDVDSYKTVGTISTIGFIVAGVGGVTGLVLLLTAPKDNGAAASTAHTTAIKKPEGVSMTPWFTGTSAGVAGHF